MEIKELMGKTLTDIQQVGEDELHFYCSDGTHYLMYHEQDCCESVTIDDICGSLDDLIGSPITLAEESTNDENQPNGYVESFTWTFYKLATVKGYVTIKWYGESNGYYSEAADFTEIKNGKRMWQ